MNKGELSENYVIFYIVQYPNLNIVDENLNVINKLIFQVIEIILNQNSILEINNEFLLHKLDNIIYKYDKKELLLELDLFFKMILKKEEINIYELQNINKILCSFIKGSSNTKVDLNANVLDKLRFQVQNLKYSIKSHLGSKPTLFNASEHTNFIYELQNIDDVMMDEVNKIQT